MVKIYLASDHAGFELKTILTEFLCAEGYEIKDLGPFEYNQDDDYVDYAKKVCEKVMQEDSKGILCCGTGQGMSRAANKHPNIIGEVCWNEETAKHSKLHSNANVLCLGGRILDPNTAKKMVKIWLETEFVPEKRHIRRMNKLKTIEKKYMKK